jgi:hypothetical protein
MEDIIKEQVAEAELQIRHMQFWIEAAITNPDDRDFAIIKLNELRGVIIAAIRRSS